MKSKGKPKGWITRNGVHIPIYENYTVERNEPKARIKTDPLKENNKELDALYGTFEGENAKRVRKKDVIEDIEASIEYVNSDWTNRPGDDTINCQACVIAAEMNRRGYDMCARKVYAKGPTAKFRDENGFMNAFKGIERNKYNYIDCTKGHEVLDTVKEDMKIFGKGSRGIVEIKSKNDGHVFNVENTGKEVVFYDAQTGKILDKPLVYFNSCIPEDTHLYRVDKLPINAKAISKVVKISGTYG